MDYETRIICEYVKNKKVLDIGCLKGPIHDLLKKARNGESTNNVTINNIIISASKHGEWLHDKIVKHAKYTLGIDIEKEAIEELKKLGYNVKVANAEEMQLGEKFDVIVARDVIDHMSNPGKFLERCREHLNDDGILIITIKNWSSFTNFFKIIVGEDKLPDKGDHVGRYNFRILKQLLIRHGFKLKDMVYIPPKKPDIKNICRNTPLWAFSLLLFKIGFKKLGSKYLLCVFEKIK